MVIKKIPVENDRDFTYEYYYCLINLALTIPPAVSRVIK